MATINLTSPIPEAGVATSYELIHATIDFQNTRVGGTVRLANADGDTVRTFHLSGDFAELGVTQATVDAIAAKIITWLKGKALLN
jgi:hypothetical protein